MPVGTSTPLPVAPVHECAGTSATDYQVLKESGHSTSKALEITIDARRGDWFARNWIALLRNQRASL